MKRNALWQDLLTVVVGLVGIMLLAWAAADYNRASAQMQCAHTDFAYGCSGPVIYRMCMTYTCNLPECGDRPNCCYRETIICEDCANLCGMQGQRTTSQICGGLCGTGNTPPES